MPVGMFNPINRRYENTFSPRKTPSVHPTLPRETCESTSPASQNPQKYIPPQRRSHPLTHSNLYTHSLREQEDAISLSAIQDTGLIDSRPNIRYPDILDLTRIKPPVHPLLRDETVTFAIEWENDLNPDVYPLQTLLTVNVSITLPALHDSIIAALGPLYSPDDPTLLKEFRRVSSLYSTWADPPLFNWVDDANLKFVLRFLGVVEAGQRKYLEVHMKWIGQEDNVADDWDEFNKRMRPER